MTFQNRVVLVTGGSSGIGAACVSEFARRGAHVSVVDRIKPPRGESALVTVGDVTDPVIRSLAVSNTIEKYGHIDILVNNVGIGLYRPLSQTQSDDELRLFDVNVFASMALSQLVISHMKSRRAGWIVNISSVGAYVGLPWSASYCASKSALHSYAESMRRELQCHGIQVSTVVPGIVSTDFRSHVLAGTAPGPVGDIRRVVSPQDVASSVVESIIRKKRRIYIPWYGRIFTGLDFFLPGIMDMYIARQWSAAQPEEQELARRSARAS